MSEARLSELQKEENTAMKAKTKVKAGMLALT